MTSEDIRQQRLQNNHLIGEAFTSPEEVVKWFGGVQSQDYHGAKWALAQRTKGQITSEAIDELFNNGKILRTHVMRPTWHFVDPRDIRWMLSLTKDRVKAQMGSYNRKLELDDALFKQTASRFVKVLEGKKSLTRQELKTHLTAMGIKTDVQRLAHIVMWAELDGILCSGPLKGKQFSYMLLEERVSKTKSLTHHEALEELTKRYFSSHGPATVNDFAWWSGLTVVDCKRGIEMNKSYLQREIIDEKTYWFGPSRRPQSFQTPLSHMLPNYDEYLIAYKGYGAIFDPLLVKKGETYSSLVNNILVIDGKVAGGWKRKFKKKKVVITYRFLRKITTEEQKAVTEEAKKYGEFLGMPIEIKG